MGAFFRPPLKKKLGKEAREINESSKTTKAQKLGPGLCKKKAPAPPLLIRKTHLEPKK